VYRPSIVGATIVGRTHEPQLGVVYRVAPFGYINSYFRIGAFR